MKKYKFFLIVAFLIGVTMFSVFQYLSSLKERYNLQNSLIRMKEEVVDLELTRQNLLQEVEKERQAQKTLSEENSELIDTLKASNDKLAKLNTDLQDSEETIEQLNSKISILKAEHRALMEKREKLALELASVSQENDAMKLRLSSIAGLKKEIKELKIQMHRSVKEAGAIKKAKKIMEGNRGFLIKDGKSTYPAKIRIEVMPASLSK